MARKYDVSVIYNPYKRFTREDINRNQFLPAETEEHYNYTGEHDCKKLINTFESLTKTEWNGADKVVIDFGCGDLRVARFMASQCKKIIGLDVSPFVLEAASRKIDEYNLDNCSLKLANEFHEENVADFIYCLQVMQHNTYDEQMQIISQIKLLLKPEGYACIHLPKLENKPYYQNVDTCMCFIKDAVEAIGENFSGFEIIENPDIKGVGDYALWVRK